MNSFDDHINPRLWSYLELLEPTPERKADTVMQGHAAFMLEAEKLQVTVSPHSKSRLKGWILPIFTKEQPKMVTSLTSIFIILSIIFGGSGVTAYAAQSSQPNEALYSVKMMTEDMQFRLTSNEQTRAEIQLQFLERRFAELGFLLENEIPFPEPYILRLQEQMQSMTHLAAQQSDQEMRQLLLRYQEMLRAQERIIEDSISATPDQVQVRLQEQIRDKIQLHLAECETGLQDPTLLRQRLMQSENGNAQPPSFDPSDQLKDGQNQYQFGPNGQDDPGKQYQGPVDEKGQQSGNSNGPGPNESPGSGDCPNQENCNDYDWGPGPESGPGTNESPGSGDCLNQENCNDYDWGPGPEAGPGQNESANSEDCLNQENCNDYDWGPGPNAGPGPNESPGSGDCLNQENCNDYDWGPGPEAGPGSEEGSGQEVDPSPGSEEQPGQGNPDSGDTGSGNDESGGNGSGKGGN